MISDEELEILICKASKIKEATESAGFAERFPKILIALQELQQRRESELRPATKYLGLTKSQQYKKIIGEVTEFSEALDLLNQFPSAPKPIGFDSARIFVLEELVDVQTACETMMAILGAGEKERNDIRRQVIEKNRRRGYYEGGASNK